MLRRTIDLTIEAKSEIDRSVSEHESSKCRQIDTRV